MTTGRIDETEQNRWTEVTLEHLLYGLLLLLAGAMRFFALGLQPLTTAEATNAWLAWLAGQGQMAQTGPAATLADMSAPSSPLLYALHSLLFWIGADGDVAARVAPALFGSAMVLLPWFLRPYLGRPWALMAALLLAVDPWLVAYSRLADGLILSLFFGLLTLIGIMRSAVSAGAPVAADNINQRWHYATAVSAGLLVVSGVGAWNFLPVLLLGWVLLGAVKFPMNLFGASVGPKVEKLYAVAEDPAADAQDTRAVGSDLPSATSTELDDARPQATASSVQHPFAVILILFGAAAVLGATGWLSQPAGLGYISTSLSDWIAQILDQTAITYPPAWLWLRLLVDQPLLLILGPIGLLILWLGFSKHEGLPGRWPMFLTAWLAWGGLWAMSAGRGPLMLPMLGLPLLLAAAHLGDWLLQKYRVSNEFGLQEANELWRETLLLVAALAILTVTGWFWILSFVNNQQLDLSLAWVIMLIFGLAAALFLGFAFWTNRRQSVAVVGLYSGLLLLGVTMSSSWQLSQTFDPLQPDGFFAKISDADVRNLAEDIAMISAQRVGDPTEISLIVQMRAAPDPVLAWYLRKMRRLSWAVSPAADASSERMPLLVTFADSAPDARVAEGFSGSRYQLRSDWLPSSLLQNGVESTDGQSWLEVLTQDWSVEYRPLLRWVLFRKITQPPPAERVVLWAAGY